MTRTEKINLSNTALNKEVIIAGTDYDRRRKLTNKEIYNLRRSYQNDTDINVIASRYNVSPMTIKYHVDPIYRAESNKRRASYAHNTSQDSSYRKELADYKRQLLGEGKRLRANNV